MKKIGVILLLCVVYMQVAILVHTDKTDINYITFANAQSCNDPSGFLKTFGTIPLGDALVLGPDCQHAQDGGPGAASVPFIYASAFGVKCDGVTDDSSAFNTMLTSAGAVHIIVQPGNCIFREQLVYQSSGSAFFGNALYIQGSGNLATTFTSYVANNCMLLVQSDSNAFLNGVTISDLNIQGTSGLAAGCGVQLYKVAHTLIENVTIQNMSGSGLFTFASAGDADASFELTIRRSTFINDATQSGFCIQANAATGGYWGSNLRIQDSTITECGVAGQTNIPPISGAVEFKGLAIQILNSGFTINNNVDFYVQGPDQSVQITIDGVDFENNNSTVLPHVYTDAGLRLFSMTNSQCLSGSSAGLIGQGCVWFNGGVQNAWLDRIQVRNANSAYVAFANQGSNNNTDTIRVGNIYWQVIAAGQTGFSGVYFNGIIGAGYFSITGTNQANISSLGYGSTMPLHLSTGEWVEFHLPNGSLTQTITGTFSANTTYNFYLYNCGAFNSPWLGCIEAVTTTPSISLEGYSVKSTDTTRTYLGFAVTNGSGNFVTGSTQSSWYPEGVIAVTGAVKANGPGGSFSKAACADLSNGAASCSTDTTNAGNISSGTLANARLPTAININSVTAAQIIGGVATGSILTLQSTSGVGSGDAVNIAVGNNGARIAERITQTGVGINTAGNPISDLQVGGIGGTNGGFEVVSGPNVTFQFYNRNTSAYAPAIITASQFNFQAGSSPANIFQLTAGSFNFTPSLKLLMSVTPPTVASGFCTSPTIPNANGTASFTINVGTGCAASTGTLTMPTANAGWSCHFSDITTPASNSVWQTGGTANTVVVTNYARTTGLAGNFTSSDVITAFCEAY